MDRRTYSAAEFGLYLAVDGRDQGSDVDSREPLRWDVEARVMEGELRR
jgi:hypothetical protein